MAQPDLIIIPFASDALPGYVDSIPDTLPPGADPQYASWDKGFPPVTMTPLAAGGIPPRGQSFNGVLNAICQHIVFGEGGGQYKWDAEYAAENGYPLGALVLNSASTGLWRSTVDGNTTDPDTGGAGWVDYVKSGIPYASDAEILSGVITDKSVSPAALTPRLNLSSPVVGDRRNVRCSVTANSASKTITADQFVVCESLTGKTYRLSGISRIINLAATGAGGMDTGAAPVNGSVAIYLIYNPNSPISPTNPSLLARNSSAGAAPEIYGGANMPAGYTASALISSWRTNASSQFVLGELYDRDVALFTAIALNSAVQQLTYTGLSISSAVPTNARKISGVLAVGSSSANSTSTLALASSAGGVGEIQTGISNAPANLNSYSSYSNLVLSVMQTLYYKLVSNGTISIGNIYISGYTF